MAAPEFKLFVRPNLLTHTRSHSRGFSRSSSQDSAEGGI